MEYIAAQDGLNLTPTLKVLCREANTDSPDTQKASKAKLFEDLVSKMGVQTKGEHSCRWNTNLLLYPYDLTIKDLFVVL